MRKSLYEISINMYKYKLEYTKAVKGRINNSMIHKTKNKRRQWFPKILSRQLDIDQDEPH